MRRCAILVFLAAATLLAACGGSSPETVGAVPALVQEEGVPAATESPVTPESSPEPEPTAAPAVTPEAATPEVATTEAATPPAAVVVDESFTPVVFNDDFGQSVAPIFATSCASCHNAGGPGSIHWQLDDAADLVATHEWISSIVQTRYMPPWPASDLSLAFHDNRSLRDDQIQAIAAWSSAGAPLDVDAATPIEAPEGVVAIDADIEIGPHETFQGSTAVADQYRCFIYDPELSESKWLQAYEFVPDQTQIVHHAIGYLAPASALGPAQALSDRDDLGGWSCFGGSGVSEGDELFLGWAPGQLPTELPEGSGLRIEPGDFIILQIHYHFDTEAPADESTIRLDWVDGTEDVDPIETNTLLGPAEIPCSANETGPLCDRDAALARAFELYGAAGVLAEGINRRCGVTPEDFAGMTNGIASSSCTIPVRDYGEIVSVFGHEHEIGSAIRMTLNPGQSDERILLDIPDWSFDWQFNYYPTESIVLKPGDDVLLECEWDRARRAPDLEPSYVLWADGTNDEMCFATIATRAVDGGAPETVDQGNDDVAIPDQFTLDIPDEIAACLAEAGVSLDELPNRELVDATVDQLFECAEPGEIGDELANVLGEGFDGLLSEDGLNCLSELFSNPDVARQLLIMGLDDSTEDERRPIGEAVGDCVLLSDALEAFGFPLLEESTDCIDAEGRGLLIQATVTGELPDEQTLFAVLSACLAAG